MTVSGDSVKAEWLSYSTTIGLCRNTVRKYLAPNSGRAKVPERPSKLITMPSGGRTLPKVTSGYVNYQIA
ncbi:hypothetical protein [Mesorhizobium sp. M0139]|uniref:hypothetical protein n=1 Tax=Mesorhizobium sp. M0139 TaxID=2956892 RepID=UPI00333DCC76